MDRNRIPALDWDGLPRSFGHQKLNIISILPMQQNPYVGLNLIAQRPKRYPILFPFTDGNTWTFERVVDSLNLH